uniref:Jupiter microtubule associated homolog 1a n=1 Tax=Oreochromis niloticus TaxID=8128 RepID=A0A669CVJ2_ORENI
MPKGSMFPLWNEPNMVLRPPGGGSNISLGADEEKPPVRKNKMASSVFAEPEDPYANRRNNPPGGKPTGVLCGEPSAPLRRGGNHTTSHLGDTPTTDGDISVRENENSAAEPEAVPEQQVQPDSWLKATRLPLLTSIHLRTSFLFKARIPSSFVCPAGIL